MKYKTKRTIKKYRGGENSAAGQNNINDSVVFNTDKLTKLLHHIEKKIAEQKPHNSVSYDTFKKYMVYVFKLLLTKKDFRTDLNNYMQTVIKQLYKFEKTMKSSVDTSRTDTEKQLQIMLNHIANYNQNILIHLEKEGVTRKMFDNFSQQMIQHLTKVTLSKHSFETYMQSITKRLVNDINDKVSSDDFNSQINKINNKLDEINSSIKSISKNTLKNKSSPISSSQFISPVSYLKSYKSNNSISPFQLNASCGKGKKCPTGMRCYNKTCKLK